MNETCERIRELLPAYALGVLNGEERAEVETHLERCPACRELAREHEEAVHALPSALAAASPVELPRRSRTASSSRSATNARPRAARRGEGSAGGGRA